ncbi:MAG TPA: sulfotransferase [Rhizomicrobium sp.]|jgi:hypothetical protein|nr:sulfotransferase [Rhizomicrobium sp.]
MNGRYPAFIVGSPRSGTSILVDVLLKAGYHGFREGNFLSLISGTESLIEKHFNAFADGNPKVLVNVVQKDRLKARLFDVLQRIMNKHNPDAPWFDKTGNPEMIAAIPILRVLWPDSVFIFAKRRGIENVLSRIVKFPSHSFEHHCADWARNMSTWRKIRTQLPPDAFMEIDQQDMIRRPEHTATALSRFLELPSQDGDKILRVFRTHRPQETAGGTAGRVTSLHATGWNDAQKSIFLRCCKEEMDAFGYAFGADYTASGA